VLDPHITSTFGWRSDPLAPSVTRLHRGLDLRAAIGDPVVAIADGDVEFAGHDPLLGLHVVIDHGQGVRSVSAHLSAIAVTAGMGVERGAELGAAGNSGRSEAPHLHLTLTIDGVPVDPLPRIGAPLHGSTVAAFAQRWAATADTVAGTTPPPSATAAAAGAPAPTPAVEPPPPPAPRGYQP
jgi:murein DD-endopeptidase MepM/ murein hydrolase activator NlpD